MSIDFEQWKRWVEFRKGCKNRYSPHGSHEVCAPLKHDVTLNGKDVSDEFRHYLHDCLVENCEPFAEKEKEIN